MTVNSQGTETPFNALLSRRGKGVAGPRMGDPRKSGDVISFTFGFPDRDSLPNSTVVAATARALEKDGGWALNYGKSSGAPPLAEALLEKLNRDQQLDAKLENLLITAGGSQGCQLVLDVLCDWGDTVIVEEPTWTGFLFAAKTFGVNCVGVPVDDQGTDVVALERELKRLKGEGITPKFIYVITNFQNPSGISTTEARRKRIIELAEEYGTMILEDDAYHDLRFSGERIPPIYALDKGRRSIYLGTLSKIMGAGMRIGWLVGPAELIGKMTALKVDGGTNIFGSYVAAEWIPEHLHSHISKLNTLYGRRRDLMLAALEESMPEGTTWTRPDGGFFIWVTLPEGIDTVQLLAQAKERGVEYLPGPGHFANGGGKNMLRLSYSFASDEQISEGIRILGEIFSGELKERGLA